MESQKSATGEGLFNIVSTIMTSQKLKTGDDMDQKSNNDDTDNKKSDDDCMDQKTHNDCVRYGSEYSIGELMLQKAPVKVNVLYVNNKNSQIPAKYTRTNFNHGDKSYFDEWLTSDYVTSKFNVANR